jgi:hypothetical protein
MEAAKTAAGLVGIETLVLEVVRPKSDILVGVFSPLVDSCTATSMIPIVIEAGDAKPSFVSRDPRLRGWGGRIRTSRRRFAEQLIKCRRKGAERTHFLPNSAGISVRWTKRHLKVRILPPQPRSRSRTLVDGVASTEIRAWPSLRSRSQPISYSTLIRAGRAVMMTTRVHNAS